MMKKDRREHPAGFSPGPVLGLLLGAPALALSLGALAGPAPEAL